MPESRIDDAYQRLAAKIENKTENLADFPATAKIFRHLLTLEQAELANAFPGVPEELAAKTGRSLESVKRDLEYMYRLGVGTPAAKSGRWNLPRSPMLFMDKLCTHHRNFSGPSFRDLLHELSEARYLNQLKLPLEVRRTLTSAGEFGNRIIPAYTAVKDKPELQPWESMKAILQMASRVTVVDCPCRIRNPGKNNCQMPGVTEVCFLLNRDAEYAVDSGSASKYWTLDEAMSLVERMEKVGMVHNVANARAIVSLLCNCCIDHCMAMDRWYREGKPRGTRNPSRYLAAVDRTFCVGCGLCVERCWFDAIARKRDANGELKATVNPKVCMGCGSCVVGCPHGALDLKCIRPEDWVPKGQGTRPGESRDLPRYSNL